MNLFTPVFSDKIFRKNEIISGGREVDALVYCDGNDIWELPSIFHHDFEKTLGFERIMLDDMWRNGTNQTIYLKSVFPWITQEAIESLRDASIRGVRRIYIWYLDWAKNAYLKDKLSQKNFYKR